MTDKPTKVACSICSRRVKASQAALWSQDATGQRTHVHITCMREKPERPAPQQAEAAT